MFLARSLATAAPRCRSAPVTRRRPLWLVRRPARQVLLLVHRLAGRATRPARRLTSRPARRLRLTDRGVVRAGAVADLVLFDTNAEAVISASTHHMRVDYSMFEGIRVKGLPKSVLSHGRTIIENGKFTGKAGSGEFIRRQTYAAI